MLSEEKKKLKRPCIIWFYSYKIFKVAKFMETESQLVFAMRWLDKEKKQGLNAKYVQNLCPWKCSEIRQ